MSSKLDQAETLLEKTFDLVPYATLLVDSDGKILQMNLQAVALFGYSQEELIGQPVEVLLPKRLRHQHIQQRSAYFRRPSVRPLGSGLELYGRRKDGGEFLAEIMLSPVTLGAGTCVICSVQDITRSLQEQAESVEMQRRLLDSLEAERLRLAQDLHDGPIQDLYGIYYQLKDRFDGASSAAEAEAEASILGMVEQAIGQLRAISGDLRPPTLVSFGLEKAIRSHLEGIQKVHPDLDVQLDLVPDDQRLPERVRVALYRIYQNAISNVLRHARASKLSVRLRLDDEIVTLEIRDNGAGFIPPARWVELARKGHFGLVGTIERAESIGGVLRLTSSPGGGTSIAVTAPLNQDLVSVE